jgi:hypothetical protein
MAQTHDDLERSAEVNELEWSFDRNPEVSHLKLHAIHGFILYQGFYVTMWRASCLNEKYNFNLGIYYL